MMNVCAFVIFFSAFLGVLEQSIKFLGLSDTAHAVVFCIFEMTTGLYRICSLSLASALPLCALAAGWSGLCIHFQTIAICGGTGLRLSRYFTVQLLRALLCAGVCCIAQWVIQ
jgi:asparagine N-glycosylation enzyme membrane subunit Stt3